VDFWSQNCQPMLWEWIFLNNRFCNHVLVGSEIIRYLPHRLVVSHLLSIGGSKWLRVLIKIRLEGWNLCDLEF